MLIQDARRSTDYADHPGVRLGLTRYLGVPVREADGTPIGTLCFLDGRSDELLDEQDVRFLSILAMRVSAELQRERLIEERVAEAQAAAERLALLNAQLVRSAAEKRRFVSAVIHDLRQPIATLRTLLYLLLPDGGVTVHSPQNVEGPENVESAESLDGAEDEREQSLALLQNRVEALSRMVDELLEYAQLDAGELAWKREAVDLSAALSGWVEEFRPEAEARGVRLTADLSPELGAFETDPAQLSRIVRNLLSNAVKFTAGAPNPAPPHVVLRTRRRSRDWVLEVEDNGIGMSRPVLRRVFKESYRSRAGAEAEERAGYPPGRGLGLCIVQRLCTAMNARITVTSRAGEGSCFRITFRDSARP